MSNTPRFSRRPENLAYRRLLDVLAVPRVARLAFAVVLLDLLAFTVLRLVFYFYFNNPDDPASSGAIFKAFYIGLKFDVRLSLLMALPVFVLGPMGKVGVFRTLAGRLLFTAYFVAVHMLAFLAYAFDFGHYAYLSERLNATALRFLHNFSISAEMIWESYPVVWISLGLMVFLIIVWVAFSRLIKRGLDYEPSNMGTARRIMASVVVAVLVLAGIYGRFSHYPLRWSEAFFSPNKFVSDLALNPLLYFAETLGLQDEEPYDIDKTRRYYPLMADYLGVDSPEPERLEYLRTRIPDGVIKGQPNVVVVILESYAFYKTGIFGNPLKPTPNFDSIASNGWLFRRFYVPSSGTARSVFAFVTGLPDVENRETSSRNPLIVEQRTVINAFEGYDKMYFLGGSANWANIRGVMSHNIKGITIYEEGSYSEPHEDVWGIPDLNLFEEANKVFAAKQKPFFAIIQTSGNHRPYTIPEDSRGFELVDPGGEDRVRRYGFESVAEFNSFRFMDHAIGNFIKKASTEDYFDNTVFVFFGDHGLPGSSPTMPKLEQQLYLSRFHVPLVIYAPGLMEGGRMFDDVAGELDVLPTLAGLISRPYTNTTLGRDILDVPPHGERYAFVISGQGHTPEIGLISDRYYFRTFLDGRAGSLHKYGVDDPRRNVSAEHPEVAARMEDMSRAFYESARYIRYNNAPGR